MWITFPRVHDISWLGRNHTVALETNNPEAKLAASLTSYLRLHRSGSERRLLGSVCSGLALLLGDLVGSDERWNPYDWIDTVSPSEATILSKYELSLEGLVIWCKGSNSHMWEPFSGVVRTSETGDRLVGYELKFGDAAWGFGKVGYGSHPGWNWSRPEAWVFTFTKGIYVAGTVDCS
jgi:hypothetical protein